MEFTSRSGQASLKKKKNQTPRHREESHEADERKSLKGKLLKHGGKVQQGNKDSEKESNRKSGNETIK